MISEDEFIMVALIQCDYVLLEKGNLIDVNLIDAKGKEIDAHTGRMPNEDEGRG